MDGAFTIQTEDKLWPWTHTCDLFSLSHSLFKRWNTDWPMCVAGRQNQRNLQTDWYVRSVVELHWETCMQVRCQKHGVLLRAICKGYVQSSPSRGAVCSDPKEKLYEWLLTHRKCLFVHSKSTTLHMRSDTLVNNDMSWITRRCLIFPLGHGIDKCNVVLPIKIYEQKEKRDNIRAGYCNMSKFNALQRIPIWKLKPDQTPHK